MKKINRLLKYIEYFFIVIGVFACGYIIFSLAVQKDDADLGHRDGTDKIKNGVDLPDLRFKSFEKSVPPPASRDFFASVKTASAVSAARDAKTAVKGRHKVVGILIGPPAQVVIEDREKKRTYFIEQGQTQDEISLQSVDKEKFVISYKGTLLVITLKEKSAEF
ncbi:MAG: hypothetical protein WCI27_10285 [Candidatus Omnitrophota bacterium]